MSIVNIIEHDEIIYNIIPRPKSHHEIPVISQWQKKTNKIVKRRISKAAPPSLGVAFYPRPDPNKFLRRGDGMFRWKPSIPVACHPPKQPGRIDTKRDALPKLSKDCDFIRANALATIRHRRRIPPMRVIDTPRGHRTNLLRTRYVRKPDYGKTPEYIEKRIYEMKFSDLSKNKKEQIKPEKGYLKLALPDDSFMYIKPRYITAPEREDILAGLKANWSQTQKEFLLLPMHTDTPPKIKKKWMMEKKLEAIERDIRSIEENEYIYVLDNEKQPIL